MTAARRLVSVVAAGAVIGVAACNVHTYPGRVEIFSGPGSNWKGIEATALDKCAAQGAQARFVQSQCTNAECLVRRFDFACEG